MSLSFDNIPTDTLTPFVFVEFNSSRAVQGPGIRSLKALVIGNRLTTGTVAAETPVKVTNVSQAKQYFGAGSQLAHMLEAFFKNNTTTEVTALGLSDAAGAKASGSFAFSGTATESGTAYAYIGGERVTVPVTSGDTASTVATAFNTEFAKSKYANVPTQLNISSGTVNVIVKNKGVFGNDLDLRLNYFDGEFLPAGLSCSVTQPVSGATNPDIQDAFDAIGDEEYHIIVHPYLDSSNLSVLEDELETRWGPMTQNDGWAFSFKNGATYSALDALGDARNSFLSTILGGVKIPTAPWQVAAAYGAVAARSLQIDPARPLQTLELKGVKAPAKTDRLTREERNLLLQAGIATFFTNADGTVRIERAVTTYKTNEFGADDISLRDIETVATLSYLRYDLRNTLMRKFPRHKLAGDSARFGAGQPIVTPKTMKAEVILKFNQWESIGLVEGIAQFKQDLIVERNASDPNRLDILLPPDLVNQLRVIGAQIQFLL
jgi:phage tail sheath gpL-like